METVNRSNEAFLEKISDELMRIHTGLSEYNVFTRELLNHDQVDVICNKLDQLSKEAKDIGEDAKVALLSNLSMHFYVLHTVGVVENPEKFSNEAARAFTLLETILLTLDGFVAKNRGKILKIISEREGRYEI